MTRPATPTPSDPRPWTVTAAGWLLAARAALRLAVPILLVIYLATGVEHTGRSADFPDGASEVWVAYLAADPENILLYPLAMMLNVGMMIVSGVTSAVPVVTRDEIWLVLYGLATAGYLVAARVVVRNWQTMRSSSRRTGVGFLIVDAVWHLVAALVSLPVAADMVGTGENADGLPLASAVINGVNYPNEYVIHFYEWMLAPWAVTVAVLAMAVPALLLARSRS